MARLKTINYSFIPGDLPKGLVSAHINFCKEKLIEEFGLSAENVSVGFKKKVPSERFQISCYNTKGEQCITSVVLTGKIVLAHLHETKLLHKAFCSQAEDWMSSPQCDRASKIELLKLITQELIEPSKELNAALQKEAEKDGFNLEVNCPHFFHVYLSELIMQAAVQTSVKAKRQRKRSYSRNLHQIAYYVDERTDSRSTFTIDKYLFFDLVKTSGIGMRNLTKQLSLLATEVRKTESTPRKISASIAQAAKAKYGLA
jgi:hypothetical protein